VLPHGTEVYQAIYSSDGARLVTIAQDAAPGVDPGSRAAVSLQLQARARACRGSALAAGRPNGHELASGRRRRHPAAGDDRDNRVESVALGDLVGWRAVRRGGAGAWAELLYERPLAGHVVGRRVGGGALDRGTPSGLRSRPLTAHLLCAVSRSAV
jgi:hypothetical protein